MNFLAKLPFAFWSRGTSNVTIRCMVSEHRNTGLKILWMNLILRTFTRINLNEKNKMEDIRFLREYYKASSTVF